MGRSACTDRHGALLPEHVATQAELLDQREDVAVCSEDVMVGLFQRETSQREVRGEPAH